MLGVSAPLPCQLDWFYTACGKLSFTTLERAVAAIDWCKPVIAEMKWGEEQLGAKVAGQGSRLYAPCHPR